MLRRWRARRKMRWAVRHLARMPRSQRQLFQLRRMQIRTWALQRMADEKLQDLYSAGE